MPQSRQNRVCPECQQYFTPLGFGKHQGSKRCALNRIVRESQLEIDATAVVLEDEGKSRILTNMANALKNRGLEDLCGVEMAYTKLIKTDVSCNIIEENWAFTWVLDIWKYYKEKGSTYKAYAFYEKLNALEGEEREKELGLMALRIYG